MITFSAPGKAVVWGEYAVLDGAPALVMALNRYATTCISHATDGWNIVSTGFVSHQNLAASDLQTDPSVDPIGASEVVRAAIRALGDPALPPGAEVHTDTSAFYNDGIKLGIGSSAAVCTATCAAIAEFLDQPFNYETALTAHRALQGTAGSGLDVAAACEGGVIRFQSGVTTVSAWPAGLHYRFIWVGHAAKTTDHLARFALWQAGGRTGALAALCTASEGLFAKPCLDAFHDYAIRLKELDVEAHLGIYDPAHRRLDELANSAQVVYKPCGAGGGDIGIAVSDDVSVLNRFITTVARESFLTLDLEIATHGVNRIRE